MSFTLEERAMKEMIENYKLNEDELERLRQKYEGSKEDTGKLTPSYGLNTWGGGSGFSSKVESVIVNRISTQERIEILEDEIYKVNISQEKALNETEKEVIEYIKKGIKMSRIAKIKNIERKEVKKTRDKAIKKMTKYIEDNT